MPNLHCHMHFEYILILFFWFLIFSKLHRHLHFEFILHYHLTLYIITFTLLLYYTIFAQTPLPPAYWVCFFANSTAICILSLFTPCGVSLTRTTDNIYRGIHPFIEAYRQLHLLQLHTDIHNNVCGRLSPLLYYVTPSSSLEHPFIEAYIHL